MAYVEQLMEQLSARDWAIFDTLHRVRLATGTQLERLHFSDLTSSHSRKAVRGRVLKRLVDARVLITLGRRVGTAHHGSRELNYMLDSVGQRLLQLRANREGDYVRIRRPWEPGQQFIRHILAVTELYVSLVEAARSGGFTLGEFQVEGSAYWPNGLGGQLKPDAFVRLERGESAADYWWYEAELAIKSRPAILTKLSAYLDFFQRGQLGPGGVMPRVIVGVETDRQQVAIRSVVDKLLAPANRLFVVAALIDVAKIMVNEIASE